MVLLSLDVKSEPVTLRISLDGAARSEQPARDRPSLPQVADALQHRRVAQATLALGLLAAGVLGMLYFVWVDVAPARPVGWWCATTLSGMAVFLVLIRSGASLRFGEPSLTVAQMVFALFSSAVAYALLGAGRGAVFPVVIVILMFGMFVATPLQMRWIGVYAVLLFGATMAWSASNRPEVYAPRIEFGHFLLIATMTPAASLLAARLSQMRARSRQQRVDLAQALARLRENTTRDELTGLVNRRHMHNLIEQEHQRCIRSGQTFCLALLDLDRFKPVNQQHGYAAGDAVLRAVAQEGLRHIRSSDTLGRWGGALFVLMMSDTRAPLARGGLERLHQKLGALRVLHGSTALCVTLSAGLAEHHAGETVEQTLQRAERALQDARVQGRARVVAAV